MQNANKEQGTRLRMTSIGRGKEFRTRKAKFKRKLNNELEIGNDGDALAAQENQGEQNCKLKTVN